MKRFLSQSLINASSSHLLVPSFQGFGCLLLLFILCFIGVHITQFTVRGWRFYHKNTPKTEKNTPTPKQPDTVYYIVEKKRRRSKPNYGEPKQIDFK